MALEAGQRQLVDGAHLDASRAEHEIVEAVLEGGELEGLSVAGEVAKRVDKASEQHARSKMAQEDQTVWLWQL